MRLRLFQTEPVLGSEFRVELAPAISNPALNSERNRLATIQLVRRTLFIENVCNQ